MRRYIYLFMIALPLLVASCAKENNKFFCETPAERMDAFLAEYKTLLESSENGWLFEYYPEKNQKYGGFVYVLKFAQGNVTAYFELADEAATSAYRMTPDDGPVLSFDTYNENLHFFADPSPDYYQGLQGDYEYNILGKSDDETEIYLKGRKSRNRLVLRKFEGTDPNEYFAKCAEVQESALDAPRFILTAGGVESTSCSLSGNIFNFALPVGSPTETSPAVLETGRSAYCFTDTGIRLYAPVTINGVEYSEFTYVDDALVSADGKAVINKGTLILADIVGSYKYSAFSLVNESTTSGALVVEESDNPEKGNVMFTTIFDTKCAQNVYADFNLETGILSVASPQIYGANAKYRFAFLSLPGASPSSKPTTFIVEPGMISGQSGWFADGAFDAKTGAYLGYFDVFDDFKAVRSNN